MTRLTPKLHLLMTLVSPKSSKCNISMNNGPIALKFCTRVQSQLVLPSLGNIVNVYTLTCTRK